MNDRKIAKVNVEYNDGNSLVIDDEKLILVIVDDKNETFRIQTTHDVDAYTILDFAHNAIREIVDEPQPVSLKPSRPTHLRVVK